MGETETGRAGGSLSSREAAMELLSLVLEGKDVSLVGPKAAEQQSTLRRISWSGVEARNKKAAWLPSSMALLMDGAQLLAGR